jgi:hypothetical protein
MAKKNDGFMSFSDIKVDSGNKEFEDKEKAFIKGADMIAKTKGGNKSGRKKKEVKADVSKVVYLTDDQSNNIDNYCNSIPVAFSTLVKQLLNEKGILN